ncbi:kinase-like domain-containing protein [Fusarium pseudoanthophilum]|uniref:Kinase-like domain-containing protein n=1 Tax=Fusarium pseudoanthophilum TaxID=48495 RepID=A0A8H5LFN2_9HYPO|nr:kinase-like domain-containing protein [Fusarium pseudoanthophilum]
MDPTTIAPFPYVAGARPNVHLVEGFNDTFRSARKSIVISRLKDLPSTESHVMHVIFYNGVGHPRHQGVLKLYDRRYARSIREVNGITTAAPLEADNAYLSFVRQGKMTLFRSALEHIYETAPVEPRASEFLDNQRYSGFEADRVARFEAAAWYENNKRFKTELRAYKQLEPFQGDKIPRLLAHIRIPYPIIYDRPQEEGDEQWDEFYCVHGLLLEYIPGPTLGKWPEPTFAPNTLKVAIQSAINSIHDINNLGVLVEKSTNNVIMKNKDNNDQILPLDSQKPFIVDFAKAVLLVDLYEIVITGLPTSDLLATEDLAARLKHAYEEKANEFNESFAGDLKEIMRET